MILKNKKIFFFFQRDWGIRIGFYIAKKLYDDGAIIGGLTFKQHKYHISQKDIIYSYLQSYDLILENPDEYLGGSEYSLELICKDLGIKSIWPYVQSLRNHVKSYRSKFYYDFKQNVPDENIIFFIKAIYKFLVTLEKSFKPEIIVMPNFVSLVHIMTYFYFKKRNVKCLAVTTSGLKNQFIFTHDFLDSEGPFFDEFTKIKNIKKTELQSKAQLVLQEEINNLVNQKKFLILNNTLFYNFLRFVYNFFLNFFRSKVEISKTFGVTVDNCKSLNRYLFRDYTRQIYYMHKCNRIKYYDLDQISNFAYMPLQFQPEANIDIISASFNNQIETARQIAMNLPDDMTLVVKDHPQMHGFRSPKYLEKILKTPNVKLIKNDYSSSYVLKKSEILISSTGTTFFESALLKKPAILLGNLGTNKILPNTKTLMNFQFLPDLVQELLDLSKKWGEDYDKEMIFIISALLKKGFNSNYEKLWETNYFNEFDLKEVVSKFENEILNILK